jgi:FdhD protein
MTTPPAWALPPVEALASGHSPANVRRSDGSQGSECLLEEAPITLVFNALHAQVLMATPLQAEDLALGFCLTEGLIDHPAELGAPLQAVPAGAGLSVLLSLPEARLDALAQRLRASAAAGGCGLCGLPNQSAALSLPPARTAAPLAVADAAILRAMAALRAAQSLHAATGAAHAAALAAPDGTLLALREDASRHCALDKLVGHCAQAGFSPAEGFLLVSSRASFEMVQKAARAGFGLLAAVSAPTALALRAAQACGVQVVGFVREGRLTRYV